MVKNTSLLVKFKVMAKDSIIYGIGSSLKSLISFLLIPIYTNCLSVADYGRLGILLITSQVITAITGLGLISALFRSYYDYNDAKNRKVVISTVFYILVASNLVFLILMILISKDLSYLIFSNYNYQTHIILVSIYAILNGLNSIPLSIFRARKESLKYISFEIVSFVIMCGLVIYLVAVKDYKVMGALIGFLTGSILSTVLLYSFTWSHYKVQFSVFEASKLLRFGIPIIAVSLSTFIFNFSDRYFIKFYLDFTQVGLYELGYNFGMILIVLFITPLRLVWQPVFLSVKDDKNANEFYSKTLTYVFAFGVILFLLVSLFSKEVIQLITNENYWNAYKVIPLIALSYLVFGCQRIIDIGISLSRKTYILSVIFVIGAILNIILNILLIPSYGIMGAAFATAITFITLFLSVLIINKKLYPVQYEWNRILKIAISSGIVYCLSLIIIWDNILLSIFFKLLILLIFPIIIYFSGFFTDTELENLALLRKKAFSFVNNKIHRKATSI